MVRGPDPSPPRPPRRWPRRLLGAAVVLLVLVAGFAAWVRYACFAAPPALAGRPAILDQRVVTDARGRRHLGACWFEEREGGSLLALAGDPFTLGYANAALGARSMALLEESLIRTVHEQIPSRLALAGVTLLVLLNNRTLPAYVAPEYRLEILGMAEGAPDPMPGLGPRYHRLLNYHAAHDISHWVADEPVAGCTAFAARGARTAGGGLLVGRNFDFEAGAGFDVHKVIARVRPDAGHAFLTVSWPGIAGVVTGLNENGLYCSINAGQSEDRGRIGTPVSLVVRRVLQYAQDLDDAVAMIEAADVFVSDGYLLADGASGRAVVVERSPARAAVRGFADDLLLLANHFETGVFAGDAGNRAAQAEGTTGARRRRLAELLVERDAPLDPAGAAAVLRDTRGAGDVPLALGHRSAINAMIATHSVVCDPARRILWVSRGRHQLGAYEAHGFAAFGTPAAPPIPADLALLAARAGVEALRRLVNDGRRQLDEAGRLEHATRTALDAAAGAAPPLHPDVLDLLAQDAEAAGRPDVALERYRAALAAWPPFLADRRRIEQALARLAGADG